MLRESSPLLLRETPAGAPVSAARRSRRAGAGDDPAWGLEAGGGSICRAQSGLDCAAAGARRTAVVHGGRVPRAEAPGEGGAPRAAAGAWRCARPYRHADYSAEPAGAVGIMRARWAHLPQLAARPDARVGARLCAHS